MKSVSSRIIEAVIQAVDPRAAVRRALGFRRNALVVCDDELALRGRLALVSVGKASVPMAEAAIRILGSRISGGVVVAPHGYSRSISQGLPAIETILASHPVPDENSIRAAGRILALTASLDENDVCLVMLSGGGSSLMSLPRPPVSLKDLQATTALLVKSGADIRRINTVRKHLSAVAGGRLAEAARCRVATLVISDVVGDALEDVASGPTVADPSSFADALEILEERNLAAMVPAAVLSLLEDGAAGRVPETPKSLPSKHFARIIASNTLATQAAMNEAASLGYSPFLLTSSLVGEARDAGRLLAGIAVDVKENGRPIPPPACIVAGGETTVSVKGPGRGGRNQEIALSAAMEIRGKEGILVTAFATDGVDGNTDAAGAWASGSTVERGRAAGLDPVSSLRDNDTYGYLSRIGELIVAGPTYTNVNDVSFVLVDG